MSMRAKCDRQKMWSYMRVFKPFRAEDLAAYCEVSMVSLLKYIWLLRTSGYMIRHLDSSYELLKDTGGSAPTERRRVLIDPNIGAVTDASQKLWNAICMLKDWDCYSLAGITQVPYATAFRYSKSLTANEYAKCEVRDKRSKTTRDSFRLLLKTGAIAPLFLDDGSVFDANGFLQQLWDLKKKPRKKA